MTYNAPICEGLLPSDNWCITQSGRQELRKEIIEQKNFTLASNPPGIFNAITRVHEILPTRQDSAGFSSSPRSTKFRTRHSLNRFSSHQRCRKTPSQIPVFHQVMTNVRW